MREFPFDGTVESWDRRASATLIGLTTAAAISLYWLVHSYFDPINDAAIYLWSARSLIAGQGYSYLGTPLIIRPPGFSVMIAPLVARYGFDFHALNLFVAVWGVMLIALLFALFQPRLGTACAACAAIALWLNPGYQTFCNQIMSDVPGTALLCLCLLVERRAARDPSISRDTALGLLIGAVSYVRSITILLVPAIVVMRLWGVLRGEDHPAMLRHALVLFLASALVLLPWSVRNHYHHPRPPVDQTGPYSYSTAVWNADPGDPSSPRLPLSQIIARAPVRFREAFSVLGSRLGETSHRAPAIVLGVAMFVCGVLGLLRRRDPAGLFLCGVVAIELVWLQFHPRHVLPVYVLSVPAAADLWSEIAGRWIAPKSARALAAVLLIALAAFDFHFRRGWEELAERDHAFAELCARVDRRLPADARLAAPRGWHYAVVLNRPVYSLAFAWQREHSPQAVEAVIDRYGINTVILSQVTSADPGLLYYLDSRYPEVESVGSGEILRVRR